MDLGVGGRWQHPLHRAGCRDDDESIYHQHPHGNAGKMSFQIGAAEGIGGLVTAAWLGIAAHMLSIHQFGALTLVLSLGSLVSLGTDLGVPLALAKVSCDNDKLDRGAVYSAISRRIIAGWVAAILLIFLWANAGHAARWWLAGVYGVSVVVTTITSSALAALRGRAIGVVEAAYQLISQVFLLVAGVVALSLGLGVAGVVVAYAVTDSLASILVPVYARRYLAVDAAIEPAERVALGLRATLPLVTADVLGNAYERIDIWLLALLRGTASVAFYVAAYKLYDSVLLPARAVAASAIAAAGRDVLHNGRAVAQKLLARTVLITTAIAALAIAVAPLLLRLAFGSVYGRDKVTLTILLLSSIPGAALVVITPIILLCRRRLVVNWTAAGLAANILANLLLVPTYGARGAATAFLVTETALLVVFWLNLPARVADPPTIATPAA